MSNHSRIVAVRAAVVGALSPIVTATPGMNEVSVSYQYVSRTEHREQVWTRNGRFAVASASMRAGRNARTETGRFEVVVLVEGVAETAEWTSDRAVEIGEVVETWISDHKNDSLGIEISTLTIDGEGTIKEMFNDAGTLCELTYPIKYTARIV